MYHEAETLPDSERCENLFQTGSFLKTSFKVEFGVVLIHTDRGDKQFPPSFGKMEKHWVWKGSKAPTVGKSYTEQYS